MFYFNVIVGNEIIQDLEGTKLHSLEEARLWAVEDARTLMSAAVLNGHDISQRSIRICDAAVTSC